jgi:hypothetical protein
LNTGPGLPISGEFRHYAIAQAIPGSFTAEIRFSFNPTESVQWAGFCIGAGDSNIVMVYMSDGANKYFQRQEFNTTAAQSANQTATTGLRIKAIRSGGSVRTFYSVDDGASYGELTTTMSWSFPTTEPILVGITGMHHWGAAQNTTFKVDWFRVTY